MSDNFDPRPAASGLNAAEGVCADDDHPAPPIASGNMGATDEEWEALYPDQQVEGDA